MENLREFVKKSKDALPTVNKLGLDSVPATATPSQAQTPRQQAIYYKDQEIGHGVFGEVHKVIRLRDGKFFAAKSFKLPELKRKRDQESHDLDQNLRREFNIMRRTTHVQISSSKARKTAQRRPYGPSRSEQAN